MNRDQLMVLDRLIEELIHVGRWASTASFREFPACDPNVDYGYGVGVSPKWAWRADCEWVRKTCDEVIEFLEQQEAENG